MAIAERERKRERGRKERRAFDVASGDYVTVTDESSPSE